MAVTHDRRSQEPVTGIAAGQRSMDVVVRDRIELSTSRFSGWQTARPKTIGSVRYGTEFTPLARLSRRGSRPGPRSQGAAPLCYHPARAQRAALRGPAWGHPRPRFPRRTRIPDGMVTTWPTTATGEGAKTPTRLPPDCDTPPDLPSWPMRPIGQFCFPCPSPIIVRSVSQADL